MENKPTLDDLIKQAEAKAQVNAIAKPNSNQQQPIQMQSRILKHSQDPIKLDSHMLLEHKTVLSETTFDEHTKSSKPTDHEDK